MKNKKASSSGLEEVSCNLCGSKNFSVVFNAVPSENSEGIDVKKFHVTSSSSVTEQVVKCGKCGLVFISPRPVQKAILSGYEDASGQEYVSQAEGRIATFKSAVRLLKKLVPTPSTGKPKVLDVGSAAGFFLKAAKDEGFDVYGVEPNKWMVEWGNKQYGLKMKSGTLEHAGFKKNYFDAVTLWDVLEHVPDPKQTLREAHGVLKKGGIVAINFPNIGSTLAKLTGRRWWFLTSVHLYYFTPKTLSKMLEQLGFETVLVKRHYQKLKLGYMLEWHKKQTLASGKSTKIHDALISLLKGLRLYDKKIIYYASQTFLVARKT